MEGKPVILYICPDHLLGGSTRSLLDFILAIRDNYTPIVLLPSQGPAYEAFNKAGIETIVHPFRKLHQRYSLGNILLHPWRAWLVRVFRYDVACALCVKKYLKGSKIDIVHSNYSPVYVGVLISKLFHAKHIWHVREYLGANYHYDVGNLPFLRKAINNADARIAISTELKKYWQMPSDNTWVINNAIRRKEDICYIPNKEKYLLFSSYILTEQKGTRDAISAFAKSGVYKYGYILKMVGICTDEYKELLLETINEYRINDFVEFVPYQSDVKPYYAHATAYIMASKYEGLGRVTAEAMFYGCPVIAHASGGTLDLIQDGVTGYLFRTTDECAELIKKVCAESQEKIIVKAQEFAVNNLTNEVYAPKVEAVYNAILKSQK